MVNLSQLKNQISGFSSRLLCLLLTYECMVRYKTKFDMKTQPKSTRQKVTMEEVNNALYKLLGAVGSSVEFTYKGGRKVKGVLLEPIEKGIILELEKDYNGANEYWERGEKKHFDNRVVYNYNCT